jgi:integrase/recombinase XerD
MAGRQAKTITPGQLRAALKRARAGRYPLRDQVMLLLSHKAGLRAAEIAGLTWSMVLTSDGQLSDRIALADSIAKKGSGRSIPVNPELHSALLRLRQEDGSAGHVIKSERAERLRATSVVNWFGEFYASLGWNGATSHSGRRSFITFAARKIASTGGSIRDVQILAGHRSLLHTQAYIDGDSKAQRRLVSLL